MFMVLIQLSSTKKATCRILATGKAVCVQSAMHVVMLIECSPISGLTNEDLEIVN